MPQKANISNKLEEQSITVDGKLVKVEGNSLIIGDNKYDLSTAPKYSDILVQREVLDVLNQLSLKDVTENLYLTVELFYVAYNGVAGAKGGTLQAEIASIQSDLAMLCNKCILTMTNFKAETQNIISLIIQCHTWLMNGKESMAIKKLGHCSESSTAMSKSANALAESFKELQVRSAKVRSNTIEEETNERDKKLAAEKAEREMKAKQQALQEKQEQLATNIGSLEIAYDDAKKREERESTKSLILGITSGIIGTISSGIGAYAAMSNPLALLSNTASNAKLTEMQKDVANKEAESTKAAQELLTAKDEQMIKQTQIDKLSKAIDELNKKINEPNTNSTDAAKLKQEIDSKNNELNKLKDELEALNKKVTSLQKSSDSSTANYAAAAASLQQLAKSTNQMMQTAANAEDRINSEKMTILNKKLELEKEKRDSLVALAEYAESIKNLKVEEGISAVSVNSLHAAVEALGKIIATLTNASLFWDQMSTYCERISGQGFQQIIIDITAPDSGLSLEDRLNSYREPSFMMSFFKYMCQWVAINGLSGEYLISAEEARKKAIQYLKESPTIDEALKKAPELAKNMKIMLDRNLSQSGEIIANLEQQSFLLKEKATKKEETL